GAGAGVYNTTRQVGSVLGSAAISALIAARMSAHGLGGGQVGEGGAGQGPIPEFVKDGFSTALSQSILLPAGILLIGFVASALFVRHEQASSRKELFERESRTGPATSSSQKN
ncbi:MFS transporter, partial [Nocardia brasiliensis]